MVRDVCIDYSYVPWETLAQSRMFQKLRDYQTRHFDLLRLEVGISKGTAGMLGRTLNLTNPKSWEFSGFSQNGEDGILDVLTSQLNESNRYCIEIGSSDGLENNSAWLIIVKKFGGIMVEGNSALAERAKRLIPGLSVGAEVHNIFVTKDTVSELHSLALFRDPDVFSLDIDGVDYFIAEALFDAGFRPKIFVVEYNAVYGPSRSVTVPYRPDFDFVGAHNSQLYFGVSIVAWKQFFAQRGYKFVTVDQNGVNAFFVEPSYFGHEFLKDIHGLDFEENRYHLRKFRMPSERQFQLIQDQELVGV